MSAFDDLLNEARDAGVQESWIERIKAASDGSPLRQENKTLKDENSVLKGENGKYRQGALGSTLNTLGFQGNPEALRVPDDLDPFDRKAVTEWAVGMQLVPQPEPSAEERQQAAELAAHDRIAAATTGATNQTPDDARRAEVLAAKTPEEFERLARLNGFAK